MPGLLANCWQVVVIPEEILERDSYIIEVMEFKSNMTVFEAVEIIVDRAERETTDRICKI